MNYHSNLTMVLLYYSKTISITFTLLLLLFIYFINVNHLGN